MNLKNWKRVVEEHLTKGKEKEVKQSQQPIIPLKRKGVPPTKCFDIYQFTKEIERHLPQAQFSPSFEMLPNGVLNQRNDERIIKASQNDVKNLRAQGPFDVKEIFFYPQCAIGRVKSRQGQGTGFLIGPNIVLTCAHNCFNLLLNQCYKEISFIPVALNDRLNFEGFKAKKILFPQKYTHAVDNLKQDLNQNQCLLYDIAILILDCELPDSKIFSEKSNLEEYFGSLGYDFDWERTESPKDRILEYITMFGFEFPFHKQLKIQIKTYIGSAFCDKDYLIHRFTTQRGMGGSPIICQDSKDCFWVRAIHQRDSSITVTNTRAALKLNRAMFKRIFRFFQYSSPLLINHYDLSFQGMQPSDLEQVVAEISKKQASSEDCGLSLSLNHNSIGEKGCQRLAQIQWKGMKEINLQNNNVGSKGCSYLINGRWTTLRALNLSSNSIGDEGCKFIANSDWIFLKQLRLKNNKIGIVGCQHLISVSWKGLDILQLSQNMIGAEGCHQLAKGKWDSLKILKLSSANIKAKGCQYLCTSDLKNLQELDLQNNSIGSEGCKYLIKAEWSNLKQLDLQNNSIGNEGCKYLAQCRWEKLQTVYLQDNSIEDQGCNYLMQASWPQLRTLYLMDNQINKEKYQSAFKQECKVWWGEKKTASSNFLMAFVSKLF